MGSCVRSAQRSHRGTRAANRSVQASHTRALPQPWQTAHWLGKCQPRGELGVGDNDIGFQGNVALPLRASPWGGGSRKAAARLAAEYGLI